MKKSVPLVYAFLFIMITFIFQGCKKQTDDPGDGPETLYRMVGQEVMIYYDTTNISNTFTYKDNKLQTFEYIFNNELYSRSNYTYDGNLIYRADTNYNLDYYDSIPYMNVEYELQNGRIVKESTTTEPMSWITYTYSGDDLTKWEQFVNAGSPDIKGEYDYQISELKSYKFYGMSAENGWEVIQKNEYEHQNGRISDVYYYYNLFGPAPTEPQMKKEYTYSGNKPDKLLWFFSDEENNWKLYFESNFTYNAEGYLTEVYEYSVDGEEEYPYYRFTFTYEAGEGNKEIFDEANVILPLGERGFNSWGLFSENADKRASNQLQRNFTQ